jgi:hypothetical protein
MAEVESMAAARAAKVVEEEEEVKGVAVQAAAKAEAVEARVVV